MSKVRKFIKPRQYQVAWKLWIAGILFVLGAAYYILQKIKEGGLYALDASTLPETPSSIQDLVLNDALMTALCEQVSALGSEITSLCLKQLGNTEHGICDESRYRVQTIVEYCFTLLETYFNLQVLISAYAVDLVLQHSAAEQGASVVAQAALNARWYDYNKTCSIVFTKSGDAFPRVVYVMRTLVGADFRARSVHAPLLKNVTIITAHILTSFSEQLISAYRVGIFRDIINTFGGQLAAACTRKTLVCGPRLPSSAENARIPLSQFPMPMVCESSGYQSRFSQNVRTFCVRFFRDLIVVGACDLESRAKDLNANFEQRQLRNSNIAPTLRM